MQTSIKWIIRLSTLSLCFILFGIMYSGVSYAAESDNAVSVSGKVIDRQGLPVKDATVKYWLDYGNKEHSVETDESGNYRIIESVENYTVFTFSVEAEGYVPYRHYTSYSLRGGEQIQLDFRIYEPSTIVGTVKDQAGRPVPDARIKVTSVFDRIVKTDQQGRYAVTGIDYAYNPNIAIWVDADGYMLYEQDRLGVREEEP